jgi:hypothetical protein
MYVMPIFLLIKKTKMYIPNDNCNTCLITMTTIGRMSGLIFRKSFHFMCYVSFLCLVISSSRYKFRIKSTSIITKSRRFRRCSIHRYTCAKSPTLKDTIMLQDLLNHSTKNTLKIHLYQS